MVTHAEKVLSSEALLGHFGVANAWELVDAVAKKELGGAPDTVRLHARNLGSRAVVRSCLRYLRAIH
jgi:hypothetical protein